MNNSDAHAHTIPFLSRQCNQFPVPVVTLRQIDSFPQAILVAESTLELEIKMSMYTTPIFYLNMGGEMLYVLQQRLKAQGIDFQKTTQGQSYQ